MEDQFWKTGPTNLMFFNDTHKEYHIRTWSDISREYKANTRRSFWDDIEEEVKTKFQPLKTGMDIDSDREIYLWVHILNENHEAKIKEILSHLNKVKDKWFNERFPKLELLIKQKLVSKRFLANSIIEYQNKHGYEAVKSFVDKFGFLLFCHYN